MTLDEFFSGFEDSRPLFEALAAKVDQLGPVEVRVTRSQIAWVRRHAFAWAWLPDRYLGSGHSPLVLSVALDRRDGSSRWKQVVEPSPGHFMHHIELRSTSEIDDDVSHWLDEAWAAAG